MKDKRLRTNLFQVWLHPREYHFLKGYSEQNMLTASETIRGWIHEIMKREGYDIKEPSLPEPEKKSGGKNHGKKKNKG